MAISTVRMELSGAVDITVTEDTLTADLTDGRTIAVPLLWHPRLVHATPDERNNWELHGNSEFIHWPDLDEDISIEGMLAGWPSRETQKSLRNASRLENHLSLLPPTLRPSPEPHVLEVPGLAVDAPHRRRDPARDFARLDDSLHQRIHVGHILVGGQPS